MDSRINFGTTGWTARLNNVASSMLALPERGVTVHSGHMGYTMRPFAGEQNALEGV
jgi:hypothetical protein